MKKLITISCLVAATTLLHAQGFIIFSGNTAGISTNSSSFYAPGAGTTGKTFSSITSPGAYDFALLESASLTDGAQDAGWTQVAVYQGSAIVAGANSGPGSLLGPNGSSGVAINAAAGTAENFLLVGWSSNLGSSWATVLAELGNGTQNGSSWSTSGFFGETGVQSATPFATAGAGDPTVFPGVFSVGALSLYAVAPVPEPVTMALAGLGGLGLLALRRKK